MSEYKQNLDLATIAPELADAENMADLSVKIKQFVDQRVLKLDYYFGQMREIVQQDRIDDDDATRFHIALNHMEVAMVDAGRLDEFARLFAEQSDFDAIEVKLIEKQIELGANVIYQELIGFSNHFLVEIPDKKRKALYAFEPLIKEHYGTFFGDGEPAAEIPAEPATQTAEAPAKSEPTNELFYEGVQFKHRESFNPVKVYENYSHALQNGDLTDDLTEQLAEAYTVRMLHERAAMREATNSDTADLAVYFEKVMGIPPATTEAILDGTIKLHPLMDTINIQLEWEQVAGMTVATLNALHPQMGETAERALTEGWVQINPKREVNGGVSGNSRFTSAEWTGAHPFVLLNRVSEGEHYTLRDLNTMAHEMTHLAHFEEQQLQGVAQPLMIENTAYVETIAHIGEHIALHKLREVVPDEAKMGIATFQSNHETGMLDSILGSVRAENALYELQTNRTEPLTFQEISDAYLVHSEYKGNEQWERNNAPLFRRGAHRMFGYITAVMGARAFEMEFAAADQDGKDALGDRFLEVLQDTEGKRWDEMMLKLGIDPTAPDFIQKMNDFQKNLVEGVAEETGLDVPLKPELDNSFRHRLHNDRLEKLAVSGQSR